MSISVSVSTEPEADKAPHNGPRRTETGQDRERVHNADFKPNPSGDDARSESTLTEKDAAVLPRGDIPVATACVQFFQSLGGAVFVAVAQTVFQNGLVGGVRRGVPGLDPSVLTDAGVSQSREILRRLGLEAYTTVVMEAYVTGLRRAYYITVACAAGAFCAAAGLSWVNIKKLGPGGVVKGVEKDPGNSEVSGDIEKDVKSHEPQG
ncbi:hypothetical protein VPNG_09767 [Cytospora leucostoma]|uniref:Uncharacterized protein n=1 Tax=Cytospora leucostoma TaxID=1230097 RepID=A0A423VLS4_9PEZI|nr:hypothetical protein VPNG_09767 [Cytospora leucostoma]